MDDFSYRLTSTGVILNPNDTTVQPFVDITKVSGLDSVDVRTTERDHEGVDGGYLDAEFEKMRTVVLEGQVIGTVFTTEAYLDSLKSNWAPRRTVVPFYFQHPGIEERLLYVKPLGVRYDSDELRRTGCCAVQFMCQAEDPRIYTSSAAISLSMSQGAAVGLGLGFPFGFPLGFGDVVSPESTNAYNAGNRPTPAVITIPGPVSVPRIYNDTTGNVLQVNLDVATGDYIEIDLGNRTIKLNGTASRRGYLEAPDWFLLQQGDNYLRYRANTTGNPNATIVYRNAWR